MTDIRIWNGEENVMEYESGTKLFLGNDGNRYVGVIKNGEKKYYPVPEIMQKTKYNLSGVPVYEGDVCYWNGGYCLVFIDNETHDAAIYDGKGEKRFLKDIAGEMELVAHKYSPDIFAKEAVGNYKKCALKNLIYGQILVFSKREGSFEISGYELVTTDGVKVKRRYKFPNASSFGLLYCLAEALEEVKLGGSKATLLKVKTNNRFVTDILSKKSILSYWQKNGWKKKDGGSVKNAEAWGKILSLTLGLSIVSEEMGEKEKEHMLSFLEGGEK